MDGMFWLSIIGTVTSIASAGIAVQQARLSRSSADIALQARNELIAKRETAELSQLQAMCKQAQRAMEKYGPGSVPSSLTGISPEDDAKKVQEFMLLITEMKAYFGNNSPNEADEFLRNLGPLLDSFARSSEPKDLRQHGTLILISLSTMTAVIKKYLDNR
jgi:hypothetical protein